MSATYDYDPAPRDDPVMTKIKTVMRLFVTTATPEVAALVHLFPFFLHVPTWFPGATLQRRAVIMRKLVDWWLTEPFEYVQRVISCSTKAG
ncbi:hypothetical protein HYDPIDRAFT_109879 [Hydnomerulius pinastri MD-312]|nr:hypothetical protein HYDPIDRAFT_109879 [Hydnomerulius pinastri MD-312]